MPNFNQYCTIVLMGIIMLVKNKISAGIISIYET